MAITVRVESGRPSGAVSTVNSATLRAEHRCIHEEASGHAAQTTAVALQHWPPCTESNLPHTMSHPAAPPSHFAWRHPAFVSRGTSAWRFRNKKESQASHPTHILTPSSHTHTNISQPPHLHGVILVLCEPGHLCMALTQQEVVVTVVDTQVPVMVVEHRDAEEWLLAGGHLWLL